MQIHYNSYTVFDRYPEWVAEEGSVQFDHPRTYCLFIGKSRISGIVSTGESVQEIIALIPIDNMYAKRFTIII